MSDVGRFRADLRQWLSTVERPGGLYDYGPTPQPQDIAMARAWHRKLHAAGYACMHWPERWGGRDASVAMQAALAEEAAWAGVPRQLNIVGPDMVGPILMSHGTPEQQERYLPLILSGDEMWCQLFSEPDAGSDLAAVRTRATQTDEGWAVTGQKVWTSGAVGSDYGILLARTGGPGHGGLSVFVVPMDAPGIDIRPLLQMDGESKFNEVYLTDVQLGADAVIGEVGGGWKVATATLGQERLSLGANAVGMFRSLHDLADAARQRGRLHGALCDDISDLWVRTWVLKTTWERAIDEGAEPGDASFSVLKLLTSETLKAIGDLGIEALGVDALQSEAEQPIMRRLLVGHAQTILGGTSEIQRNILAERLLGLPRAKYKD